MKILFTIFTLLGSLGLFMFGMRIMSEALQKAAGIGLRKNLASITKSKFRAILSGTLITGGIQSSSATTIMVVSFVNAGLLTLSESAGLIMGANIGTTVTAWLVSIFGFNFNINMLTLPLIGIAFPFYFSSNKTLKYWSEFIVGFALIFIALDFIKNVFPDIGTNPDFFNFVAGLTDYGFSSVLLFVFLGFIITSIIQSSSVAAALTAVMCAKGLIGFEHAAAMIIGENIGTCVTAIIASFMANKTAKKTALFHIIFNISGLLWILPLFNLVLKWCGSDNDLFYQ